MGGERMMKAYRIGDEESRMNLVGPLLHVFGSSFFVQVRDHVEELWELEKIPRMKPRSRD